MNSVRIALLAIACAVSAVAQIARNWRLLITVVDPGGAIVPGATGNRVVITVANLDNLGQNPPALRVLDAWRVVARQP